MPMVADAVAGLAPGHVAASLRDGRSVVISVGGHDHELGAEDLLVTLAPLDGYRLEREGSHAVALELALDDDLIREGLAREIVHAVQAARKAAGLDVEDRIALTLDGDAAPPGGRPGPRRLHRRRDAATALAIDGLRAGQAVTVDGRELVSPSSGPEDAVAGGAARGRPRGRGRGGRGGAPVGRGGAPVGRGRPVDPPGRPRRAGGAGPPAVGAGGGGPV